MNYLEMILLIKERNEKVISDRVMSIQTDKHLYARKSDGNWEEQELLVMEESLITLAPEVPRRIT